MRIFTLVASLALVVLAVACSSDAPRPATVRNYGPEVARAPSPGPAPVARRVAVPKAPPYTPAPGAVGAFRWHTRLGDAQAEARATGRVILCLATKPNCGLCDKFKDTILPPAAHRVQPLAVGYLYDITRPERREVDQILRANLRGADLMPLVGFLTPGLRFLHGFWGARSTDQFRGDLATVSRLHRVARVAPEPAAAADPHLALRLDGPVLNEFGEPEWSAPGDVWPTGAPEPLDAIRGAPGLPAAPAGTMLADAPADLPTGPPASSAARPLAALPPPPPPPAPRVPRAPRAPRPAPEYAGIQAPEAGDLPLPPTPEAAPTVAEAPAAPPGSEAWGRRLLEEARDHIRGGRFDAARTSFEQIEGRMPDAALAREAAKGRVALYNAKKIRLAASSAERNRYLARARRDLASSMWSDLFAS